MTTLNKKEVFKMKNVIEGLNLMKTLYAHNIEKHKVDVSVIFPEDLAKEEIRKANNKAEKTGILFENLIKKIDGEDISFSKQDSITFKKVLGYCSNYLSSLEKMGLVGHEESNYEKYYNKELKNKQEIINNVFKELRQSKVI